MIGARLLDANISKNVCAAHRRRTEYVLNNRVTDSKRRFEKERTFRR